MFKLAFLVGTYAYSIFFLGLCGLLYKNLILISFLIFLLIGLYLFKKAFKKQLNLIKTDKYSKLLIIILCIQALVNLLGVLGPEISFDALWYHLTLPKIYLQNHAIFHISGNLLYYSDMPKNIEMLYILALSLGNEITAKLMHFVFGILTLMVIYKIARRFLNIRFALFALVLFYSNLVVGWESIAAYIDLGTAFFTATSFYLFLNWFDKKNYINLLKFSIIVGMTLATKIASLNLLPIFIILILVTAIREKEKYIEMFKNIGVFIITVLIFASPWYIFSFINTGNALYPLFDSNIQINNVINLNNLFNLFINSPDPINPIYIISIPLIIVSVSKFNFKQKILFIYSLLALCFWFINSQIGGSRFMLPYLTVFSILVMTTIDKVKIKYFKNYVLILIILISLTSIGYRLLANYKYIPYVLGHESKTVFLTKHLNFSFGDFYDTDNYFKDNLTSKDTVLLYGFHNLYYVNFSFIDSTYIADGDKFKYIAVQNSILPDRFKDFKKIYYNDLTKVGLYSKGDKIWEY